MQIGLSQGLRSTLVSPDDFNGDVLNTIPITKFDPFRCGQPLFLIKKPKFIRDLELEYGIDTEVYIPNAMGKR